MQSRRLAQVWAQTISWLRSPFLLSYLVNSTTNISGSSTFQAAPDITVIAPGTAQNGVDVATPKGVLVVSSMNNNGSVYVGGSDVSNASGGKRGAELSPLGS